MEFPLLLILIVGAVMAFQPRRRFRRRRRSTTVNRTERRSISVRYEEATPAQRLAARESTRTRVSSEILLVDVVQLRGRAWVIDGDTIDINGTRIRLAGIDAPEMDHPYGKNAKWTLVNLCKGHEVCAVFDGEQSYERTVATCYLPDGRDLSAEMVKTGMAIDWPKFSRGKYSGLELPGIRKKLWRCDARQKGLLPPGLPD